jgi:hypothetical protein
VAWCHSFIYLIFCGTYIQSITFIQYIHLSPLGPALQQADALPSELRRTLSVGLLVGRFILLWLDQLKKKIASLDFFSITSAYSLSCIKWSNGDWLVFPAAPVKLVSVLECPILCVPKDNQIKIIWLKIILPLYVKDLTRSGELVKLESTVFAAQLLISPFFSIYDRLWILTRWTQQICV